jgi:thiamine-monophosphate kinase
MTGFTEDELIETIGKILSGEAPGVRLGAGRDDAALVEPGRHLVILTADMLVEGVHFELTTMSARDLGYRAVTVNVSDVAAMGGSPRFGLVTLGLPKDTEASWVVELFGGLREGGDEYAVALVGGDLSRADRVVISVTVTGEVPDGGAVTRSGARPGDRIVVTGALGAAAGGLRLSRADPHLAGSAVASEWGRSLLAALFRPLARVGEGQSLAQAGATAMMDVSDGLSLDLSRLCKASGVGAAVALDRVPVAEGVRELCRELGEGDPLIMALEGGEDFELLATLPAGAVQPAAASLRERFATPLTDIGEVRTQVGVVALDPEGRERPLEPRGWDHFAG